jgi:hypothetical protein
MPTLASPVHTAMPAEDIEYVSELIIDFYQDREQVQA